MSLFFEKTEEPPAKQTKQLKKQAQALPVNDQGMFAQCHIVEDRKEIAEILCFIAEKWPVVAFDYETTGLRPHKRGHKIVSVSFSNGKISYAFSMLDIKKFEGDLREVLGREKTKKVAHNMRMEASWTQNLLGYSLEGQHWDTLIAERCLRNNSKKLSLEYLAEKYFDVVNYKEETTPYLEASAAAEDEFGGNAYNRILECPQGALLLRNAMDSLLTFKIYETQKEALTPHQMQGFGFFMEGQLLLQKMHENGMQIDPIILAGQKMHAVKKMNKIEREIYTDPDVQRWPGPGEFKFNSSKDLGRLLFDTLKIKPVKLTKGGAGGSAPKPSTDEEALSKMKIPLTEKILLWRKWQKAHGTYIAQFEREPVDGTVHSFINLARVDTFRSSGDSPNIQNIYKREPEMKKFIRSFIKPRPGNKLVEWDYKACEVVIAACYTKDPNLLAYVSDPKLDMHRDMACQLFLRTPETVDKVTERGLAKGGFVFAEFYGSYYKQVAEDMWERMAPATKLHLKENGIKSLAAFTKHVETIERDFWGRRFAVYDDWKKKQLYAYERKGYVELYTGFRCYGPMDKKQVSNYPIQGSAFHCLLWWMVQAQKEIEKHKLQSQLVYEIHDAGVGDVVPAEEAELDKIVKLYGTEKVREHWPWIIAPLIIEKESSEINGSWAEMKGQGVL